MTPQEKTKVATLIEKQLSVSTLEHIEALTALADAMNEAGVERIRPGEIHNIVHEMFGDEG